MIKEKEMLQTILPAGEYLAPSIKVKDLKCRRVMCQSITSMGFGTAQDDSTNGDFE